MDEGFEKFRASTVGAKRRQKFELLRFDDGSEVEVRAPNFKFRNEMGELHGKGVGSHAIGMKILMGLCFRPGTNEPAFGPGDVQAIEESDESDVIEKYERCILTGMTFVNPDAEKIAKNSASLPSDGSSSQ